MACKYLGKSIAGRGIGLLEDIEEKCARSVRISRSPVWLEQNEQGWRGGKNRRHQEVDRSQIMYS